MNKFKGNSDERMIELYQQRIDGFKHEIDSTGGSWVPRSGNAGTFCTDVEYRIVKQTRVINGITVPMCMTEKPEINQPYYTMVIGTEYIVDMTCLDDKYDNLILNNGLMFHTESDAKLTMKAILAGTKI